MPMIGLKKKNIVLNVTVLSLMTALMLTVLMFVCTAGYYGGFMDFIFLFLFYFLVGEAFNFVIYFLKLAS